MNEEGCTGCTIKEGCSVEKPHKCPCIKCLVKACCSEDCEEVNAFFEDEYFLHGKICI